MCIKNAPSGVDKINVIHSRQFAPLAEELKHYSAVFFVADKKVSRNIAEPLAEFCARMGVPLRGLMRLKISERLKTPATVIRIHRWLIGVGADRDAVLVAIGGGVTTDVVGFAASTYRRGIRSVNVPTTLLGQADAAIGGKTGCNVDGYKNMCGTFHMPEFTYVNTDFIRTLPWEEFISGYAELLKTFIVADRQAYERAIADFDFRQEDAFVSLSGLVRRCGEIKASIVERDFKDRGERKLLNLGHTFAHAIEFKSAHSLFHRRISHGQSVAIGIVMAAQLSEQEGVARKGTAQRITNDFLRLGLRVECPWSREQLTHIISKDKKSKDGKVQYVLIRDIGDCIVSTVRDDREEKQN